MRFACACGLALITALPAAAGAARPAVKLAALQPVTLKGAGFGRYERVRLTVRVGDRSSTSKRLRAGARGRFVAVFREYSLGRCGNELSLVAVGGRGSRVSWALAQPACFDE